MTTTRERLFVIVKIRPGVDDMTVTRVGTIVYSDSDQAQAVANRLARIAAVTEDHPDSGWTLDVRELVPVPASVAEGSS